MTGSSRRLRELARRITDVYLGHMPLRGALLTGPPPAATRTATPIST